MNGTCGLRNVATKPGGTETFGVAWVVPNSPVDVWHDIYSQDYTAPTYSWAGASWTDCTPTFKIAS